MNNIALKVENLSKLYQLGQLGTGTLSRDIERWWAKVRGMEDPYTKIGALNDRSKKSENEFVWALKDINFEVKKGEVLGIIGRNGAGKSTLLKILSRVTAPTTGKIKINGRIASLLEVGTGFHPEMTGRENIYINGAILGMRKLEIRKKFDAIVDFSGVEAYIDTPVKRYSSGMYVRLAFAVAAFLDPEILIVDEVLAVGDAEFQKKCLGRMKDVSVNEGRTVLFVSHNMGAISSLCESGLLIQNGSNVFYGNTNDAIDIYRKQNFNSFKSIENIKFSGNLNEFIKLNFFSVNNINPLDENLQFLPKQKINFTIGFYFKIPLSIRITVAIFKDGIRLFSIHDAIDFKITDGEFVSNVEIPSFVLRPGSYSVAIGGHTDLNQWFWIEDICELEILSVFDSFYDKMNIGLINLQQYVITKREDNI